MTGRMTGLLLLSVTELLGGLSLRNEALAVRGRAELHRRQQLVHRELELEYRALLSAYLSPEAARRRAAWRAQWRNERGPEL